MRYKIPFLLFCISLFFSASKALSKNLPDTGKKITGIMPVNPVIIARITGNSLPGETLPNPNQTAKNYDLGGTDLGIMWAMGHGKTGMWFGDTFGSDWTPDENGKDWRSNVLAFSDNQDLDNGIKFNSMAMSADGKKARMIINSVHDTTGKGDFTAIPTGAIRVKGVDYVSYMDVKQWLTSGRWNTNYSGLYQSTDDGKNWTKTAVRFSGTSHFAQTAFAKKDGYVYLLGIDSGRFGGAHVARFREKDILNQAAYQYWVSGQGWVTNAETAATSLFGPTVGEPSLAYNTKYHLWMATYIDMTNRIIQFRYAPAVEGPWSNAEELLSSKNYSGLYGGFIYPYKNDGDNLYFVISMWFKYNTFLMKATLKPVM
jgi:hypothetical protein